MEEGKLYDYLLMLADSSLIMGQRLSEWCGRGPIPEQEIAMSNIILDLIGQARLFYQEAARIKNDEEGFIDTTEDTLAYLRDAHEFKNVLLCEVPNGDWGQSVLKVLLFANWQNLVYERLSHSSEKELADIARKSLKETDYHVGWSRDWVLRLGDGTKESHERMQKALDFLWPYVDDMLKPAACEQIAFKDAGEVFFPDLKATWIDRVSSVLKEATLAVPDVDNCADDGKAGKHTPHLSGILDEMQRLQRTYPGLEW